MRSRLEEWRDLVFERDHKHSPLDSTAILSDEDVLHLSSVGQLAEDSLEAILGISWPWWSRYGTELTAHTRGVEVTFVPLPKPARKPKRGANEQDDGVDASTKKPRASSQLLQPPVSGNSSVLPEGSVGKSLDRIAATNISSGSNSLHNDSAPNVRRESVVGPSVSSTEHPHFFPAPLTTHTSHPTTSPGPFHPLSETLDGSTNEVIPAPYPQQWPWPGQWQWQWPAGQWPWPQGGRFPSQWPATQYHPIFHPVVNDNTRPQAPPSQPPPGYGPAPHPQP